MHNPIQDLTKKEWLLWLGSLLIVILSNLVSGSVDVLTLVAVCVGITSLIFAAKGNVWAQILMIVFSILYGIISWRFRYWGEMITYLGMTMTHGGLVYDHVDPEPRSKKRKRSGDPEAEPETYRGAFCFQRGGNCGVLLHFAHAGYAEYRVQYHFRYHQFSGGIADHAAFLLLCVGVCHERYCADRAVGTGIAEKSGVYPGGSELCDFLSE